MQQIKEFTKKYYGLEAVVAALFYTILLGTIHIGGLHIKTTYLIAIYILLKVIYKLEGRVSIVIALGFFGLAGIFLAINAESKANWAAQIAFVYLVIGVIWQIVELISENNSKIKASNQKNYVRFSLWSNKQLIMAIIVVFVVSFYSYKATSKYQGFQQTIIRINKSNKELLKFKRNTFIEVISSNGKLTEAGKLVDLLRTKKLGVIRIGEINREYRKQTLIFYKDGSKAKVDRLVKILSKDYYPIKATEKLSEGDQFDIVIFLGKKVTVTP